MKKTLRTIFLTLLAAVSLCAFACAAELAGECGANGGNVTWHLDTESGVMTISGSGDMKDLETHETIWGEESAHIKTVIVEEGVTSIGDCAFLNCNTENLTAVTLPESLTEIGGFAFGKCGALTQINFPKKLKVIELYAFSDCSALPSAILPDSVTVLREGAFEGCSSLVEVKLPAWIGTIGYGLFNGCLELRSIVIPHQVTDIDSWAFNGCKKLNTIYLPKSLTTVAVKAFDRATSLRTIHYAGTAEEWKNVNIGPLNDTFSRAQVIYGWVDDTPAAPPETLSGECGAEGGNVRWTLEDGVLTLSGTGAIADYNEMGNPWYGYRDMVTELVIGEGITEVGSFTFDGLGSMSTVTLPRSLEKLNRCSFRGCGITHITLPETLKDLGLDMAFINCTKLESVKIFAQTDYLPDSMFAGCTALKTVEMPGIRSMGDAVFSGCTSLTEITIPEGVRTIGQRTFYGSGLKKVTIPQSVTNIEPWAFQNCAALETLELPADTEKLRIGVSAFENCTALKELVIPEGNFYLRKYCFAGCTALERVEFLTPVTFEDAVYVGDCAGIFENCTSLKEVILSPQQTKLCTGIFAGCAALETLELPEEMTAIPDYLFADCTALKELKIPADVIRIGDGAFVRCTALTKLELPAGLQQLGQAAFVGCTALTEMRIPDGISEIKPEVFEGCTALTRVELPGGIKSIGDEAFRDCASLASIDLPGGLETIGNNAFDNCDALTEVMLPDSVNALGAQAFLYCDNLKAIRIPAAVTELERNIFYDTPIQTVYYGGSEAQWAAVNTTGSALSANVQVHFNHVWQPALQPDTEGECGGNVNWHMDTRTGTLTLSGSGAVRDYVDTNAAPWAVWGSRVKTVVVEEGVTAIGDMAFSACNSITAVTLADSITRIGQFAFSSDTVLTELELPAQLKTIGESAFAFCTLPEKLVIPDSVTELGINAFSGCEGLKEVCIGKGVTDITDGAFQMCEELRSVTMSERVQRVGHAAFRDCGSLEEIALPENITQIGYEAFGGWIALKKVYFGGTQDQWNRIEFYHVNGQDGNHALDYAEYVWEWDGWEEALPTVSGTIIGSVQGAIVVINGSIVGVNSNGSFSASAVEGFFDVVIRVPGALSCTVKNVTAENGDITLPEIVPVKGDTNGDDMINIVDMGIFRQNFGKMGATIGNAYTDTNGDNMVNIIDMSVFRTNFGKTAANDCTYFYSA